MATSVEFLKKCLPCGGWCCKGENIFASTEELHRLGVSQIDRNPDGTCMFYEDGKCSAYSMRPLECRIFPLDILEFDGMLYWARWEHCPASELLRPASDCHIRSTDMVADFAAIREIEKRVTPEYARAYVEFHKTHQPEKYTEFAGKVSILAPFSGGR